MNKKLIVVLLGVIVAGAVAFMVFNSLQIKKAHEQVLSEQANAKDPWTEANEQWLADVAQQEGMQKTQSGIIYKVLNAGEGAIPTAESTVRVHYEGSDINGKVFDSSYERGEATEFGVTQVIKGWTEVLCMMPVGSKWEVYIPSELAYGKNGAGSDIYPNSALKFIIELVDIVE